MNEGIGVSAEEAQDPLRSNPEVQPTVSPEAQADDLSLLVETMKHQLTDQGRLLTEMKNLLEQSNGQLAQLVRLLFEAMNDSQKNSNREFGRQGETQDILVKILGELRERPRA